METMNGYVCFWEDQKVELRANSSLQARGMAAAVLTGRTWHRGPRKAHEITVVLAEKAGTPVTHSPTF